MSSELAVEERLRRLESQVRRARMWSVATTVALGAVVFASMQVPQAKETRSDTLVARELRIVDEKGVTRATLGPDNDNPSEVSLEIRARDRQKGPKARIRVADESATIELDGDGLPGAVVLSNDDREASVELRSRVSDRQPLFKATVAKLSAHESAGALTLERAGHRQAENGSWFVEGQPKLLLESSNAFVPQVTR